MPGDGPPFRFSIRQASPRIIEIEYAGYMPEGDAHVRRTEAMISAASLPVGLCYDVSSFTSFHRSQVKSHGDMLSRLGKKVTGVALVGARPVVRFGAITASLMSKTPLSTFDDRSEALAWLESLR